jgi:hypothetical protein
MHARGMVFYTHRNEFPKNVPSTPDRILAIKITDMEFSHRLGLPAVEMRASLDTRRMECSYFGVNHPDFSGADGCVGRQRAGAWLAPRALGLACARGTLFVGPGGENRGVIQPRWQNLARTAGTHCFHTTAPNSSRLAMARCLIARCTGLICGTSALSSISSGLFFRAIIHRAVARIPRTILPHPSEGSSESRWATCSAGLRLK